MLLLLRIIGRQMLIITYIHSLTSITTDSFNVTIAQDAQEANAHNFIMLVLFSLVFLWLNNYVAW